MSAYAYDAFISYKNIPAEQRIARALQQGLHRFARPLNRLRAMRTYRDETNIAASPDLWGDIEQALKVSRCFLYLASPGAAASPWVRKELEWWLRERGSSGLFVGLVGGTIEFNSDLTIDRDRTDSIPDDIVGSLPRSPFFVDLRASAQDPTRQTMADENFRNGVHKLSSAIFGRPLDELAGEDIRQHRIRTGIRNLALTLLSLLSVAMIVAFVLAHNANEESKREAQLALLGQGRALASTSALSAELGDGTIAALYAAIGEQQLNLRAPRVEAGDTSGVDQTARRQIEFSQFKAKSLPLLLASFDLRPRMLPAFDFSTDRLYVASDGAGIQALDPLRHPVWSSVPQLEAIGVGAIATDRKTGFLASITSDGLLLLDPDHPDIVPMTITRRRSFSTLAFASKTGDLVADLTIFRAGRKWERVSITDSDGKPASMAGISKVETARAAPRALVISRRASSAVIDLENAKVTRSVGGDTNTMTVDGSIAPDGSLVALRDLNGRVDVYRTNTGEPLWHYQASSGYGGIAFSQAGSLAVATAGEIQLLDGNTGVQMFRFKTGRPDDVAMSLRFSARDDMLLAAWQSGHYEFFAFNLPTEVVELTKGTQHNSSELTLDASKRWMLSWTNEGSLSAIDLDAPNSEPVRWDLKTEISNVLAGGSDGEWTILTPSAAIYQIGVKSKEPALSSGSRANVKLVVSSISDSTWAVMKTDGEISTSTGVVIPSPPEVNQIFLDGRAGVLGAVSDNGFSVWRYSTAGAPIALEKSLPNISTATFSNDGQRFAVGCDNGDVHVFSLDGSKTEVTLHPHTALILSLIFDPMGKFLVGVSLDGTKTIMDLGTKSVMTFEGTHGMEAQRLALSTELGLVASSGEDGEILLNGISHGGLVLRLSGLNGRVSAMQFVKQSLVFAVDDGSVRRIKLNALSESGLELLRYKIGRNLSADERTTFGLSSRAPRAPSKIACLRAFDRSDNPYAAMSGIVMDARDFGGQAELCLKAADDYPGEACWSRLAGTILRQSAISKEAIGRRSEALSIREKAYALTRIAAEKGCVDASLDLIELGSSVRWAQDKLREAGDNGDDRASSAQLRLEWGEVNTEDAKRGILEKLGALADAGNPWAMEIRASLLARQGLVNHGTQIFRDSFRAGLIFEACDISDPSSSRAAALRALALAGLDDPAAIAEIHAEKKAVGSILSASACSRFQSETN